MVIAFKFKNNNNRSKITLCIICIFKWIWMTSLMSFCIIFSFGWVKWMCERACVRASIRAYFRPHSWCEFIFKNDVCWCLLVSHIIIIDRNILNSAHFFHTQFFYLIFEIKAKTENSRHCFYCKKTDNIVLIQKFIIISNALEIIASFKEPINQFKHFSMKNCLKSFFLI